MQNLLEFLQKYHHWFLFVLLEIVSLVLLFRYNSYQGSAWLSSANAVAGHVNSERARVESFFSLTKVNKDLTLRNFYLERQVTQLRKLYAELTGDTTAAERQELQMLSHYELIPAKVVTNELNRPDNLMTIDRGAADGVEVGMGVACGQGMLALLISSPTIIPSSSQYSILLRASVAPYEEEDISAYYDGMEKILT